MRVAVCVKRDLFGLLALKALWPALAGHEVRLFCSVKTRPVERAVPELRLMRLLERDLPLDVVLPLALRGGAESPAWLPSEAAWQKLPDLRPAGGGALLRAARPDLVISVRFSLIFPPALIDSVPLGILNLHPGALPGYRGLFAPFWQCLHGERELGCSLHWVDPGIDTGPILGIARVGRDPGRSLLWHTARLYEAGIGLAGDAVRAIAAGDRPEGAPQLPGSGAYFRFPSPQDFAALARGGMPLASPEDYLELLGSLLPGAVLPQESRPDRAA
jgi:hypothetical protein